MKIEIKSRYTGEVLFAHESENNTIKLTVEAAVSARANLAGANLSRANLAGANLSRANLAGAYLDCANLAGAYLDDANLARANLDCANLAGANLARAYLGDANLARAYLGDAYIALAYLARANLAGAYLDGETLTMPPVSICNLKWDVLITGEYMRIGCQRHRHEDWAAMDDKTINDMATGALDFWKQWRGALLEMCKQHKAQ